MGFWDYAKWAVPGYAAYRGVKAVGDEIGGESQSAIDKRAQLNEQGAAAGQFAGQGEAGYGAMTGQLGGTYGRLGEAMDYQNRLMRGENSVAAEQLRQGMQQGLAAQRSMAAGAAPQNSAMAARQAAMNMGRLGYGLSGQQALAGLQERNMAASQYGQLGQALGQLQLGQRGQDVNVALGSRGNAINAYGGVTPEGSWLDRNKLLLQGAGAAIGAA